MKKSKWLAARVVMLLAVGATRIVIGQETTASQNSFSIINICRGSATDLQAMLEAIESVPPIPFDPTSKEQGFGTYWSAQYPPGTRPARPPLPANFWGLPVWPLGGGQFILDDRNVDYAELRAEAEAAALLSAALEAPRSMMMSSLLNNTVAYGNPVYLTNLTATVQGAAMTTAFTIGGGTNNVPYDILTTTNVSNPVSQWTWLGIGYTSNRYSFSNQPANQAFYILAKPVKTMVVGWGADDYQQCDVWPGITNALMVAGGLLHSLAVLNDGSVRGWGNNNWGQISIPTNVVGASMVAAGWYHSVALLTNGTVKAWGLNLQGIYNLTEVPANLTNVTVISAHALHTLALKSDGTLVAWGYNNSGETNIPVGLSNVVAISAGYQFNLAAKADGTVTAWGNNTYGQCTVPAGLSNVVDVAAGPFHSLALLKNGTVVCWGDGSDGETNVPAGLTNVVAISANGYPSDDIAYNLALKSDGTVVSWGEGGPVVPLGGLNNVIVIGAGSEHALAIRTGPRTPVITLQPTDQYQLAGGNVTFAARGTGLYGVTYQWQTNGVNLAGATNSTLTLTNVQAAATQPSYDVVVNDGTSSIVSSNVHLYLVTSPTIISQTILSSQFVLYQTSVTLSIVATAPGQFDGFPLSYQWKLNGTNISGATTASYTFTATTSGTYSVVVSNAVGNTTAIWQITVIFPGGIIPWGSNTNGQLNSPTQITNVISIAAGKAHGVVALESGSVTNWGSYWTGTNFVPVVAPPLLTNAIAVAAGSRHDLALKSDGTVIAWGWNDFGQTNVPTATTNIIAISAGGQQNLALKSNGTIVQWGQTNGPIPAGLTNVTAVASGTNFNLALLKNSTVVAWGANNYGQTNVPATLSNVVAIAASGSHALALKIDGTVTAWGSLTNVPTSLSNVMNVAAGENHSIALKNDGTVVAWGDNSFGQTNVVVGLNNVKFIAGGGDFNLAIQFSPLIQYPVDVTKDLLLIYNSNSADSSNLCAYYLAHRPMIAGANVLSVSCQTGEFFTNTTDWDDQLVTPVLNWLTNNPTKRPQYVILFYDIPTRLWLPESYGCGLPIYGGSVSYHIQNSSPTWTPFVNHLNAGSLADCKAYVDKIAAIGSNYCPGKLVISASGGGYGNTNYVLDNVRQGNGFGPPPFGHGDGDFSGNGSTVSNAITGLTASGVSSNAIIYNDGLDTITTVITNGSTNLIYYFAPQITNASNVAGYMCWGEHSGLGGLYPTDGKVKWSGHSGWWIIETVESFNGTRGGCGQGNIIQWLSSNAFGGTNYSNTPIGAVSHTEEPRLPGVNNSAVYFGLWASGKNFAICAWNSRNTAYFQVIGDPFVTK